jgi:arabinose-5-phosphate isomerase
MHGPDEAAFVPPEMPVKEVIIAMTRRPLGGACVVAGDRRLVGFVTDGDLRRALTACDDIRGLRAHDIMTASPVTIGPEASLGQALELMERRRSQISVLPVVDDAGRAAGILRIHDIYLGTSR